MSNDKAVPTAIFSAEDHKYTFLKDKSKKSISVTSLISKFKDSFDSGYWATYKAVKNILGEDKFRQIRNGMGYDTYPLYLKPPQNFIDNVVSSINPKAFFTEKQAILAEWERSGTEGTAFHENREKKIYSEGGIINPWDNEFYEAKRVDKNFDNESLVDNLYSLEDGVYPELLVWLELSNTVIFGQIDECFIKTVGDKRYVDTDDSKTNKSVTKGSKETYYKPFNHLKADKLTDYALQASFYNVIMKSHGYTPRNQALTHYKNYDPSTGVRYDLPFYEKEVNKMISMFDAQNK